MPTTKATSNNRRRSELIDAMALAAWWASGEPQPWLTLPASFRREWSTYQEAALVELENRVPEIRRILNELSPDLHTNQIGCCDPKLSVTT